MGGAGGWGANSRLVRGGWSGDSGGVVGGSGECRQRSEAALRRRPPVVDVGEVGAVQQPAIAPGRRRSQRGAVRVAGVAASEEPKRKMQCGRQEILVLVGHVPWLVCGRRAEGGRRAMPR